METQGIAPILGIMSKSQLKDDGLRASSLESVTTMRRLGIFPVTLLLVGIAVGQAQTQQTTKSSPPPAQSSKQALAAANNGSNISPASMVDPATYVIGSEDTLQITVWKEPTLSGTIPVRPDGNISLVLAGDMPAAGRTPMQLSREIEEKLKKYVQDPNVSIIVTGVNSHRIYMVGEVGHVGAIPLTAGMSPLQAIAAAGGLSPFANTKKIYILRGEQGQQKKIPFNYKAALKGESAQNITLLPGDTIVVP